MNAGMTSRGGPTAAPTAEEQRRTAAERVAVDASTRLPVLVFFASSVFWLVVGSIWAVIASIKMHSPWFLGDYAWLTFGRARSVHLNTVVYGWASMAGIGVLLWLMARLCRAELRYPRVLLFAAASWNVGVTIGSIGILAGDSTSIEWMEFPPYAPPFLAVAFLIVSVWGIVTFRDRREPHVYVSQWYIFAALFWFPWLYTVANLLMLYRPIAGVPQASVNWWYGHNVLANWFTPLGLASAYYLIPKVIGRPIHSYYLSILGFWSFALFYNWNGNHHLIGGPLPAWLISVSIVASLMMVIPVITVAINHHSTMVGHFAMLRYSPTLRFVVFGAMSYTLVSVQGSSMSLRSLNATTHFTHYTIAHSHLGLYAFFTMIMFGSMYYIVPRLTGWEWASSRLISAHFWLTAGGVALYFVSLTYGGLLQGLRLNDPKYAFLDITRRTVPYLWARSVGGIAMTLGHFVFAYLFAANLLNLGERRDAPMMFGDTEEHHRERASHRDEGEEAVAALEGWGEQIR